MTQDNIKIYNTENFSNKFIQSKIELDKILKSDFNKFFISKVEDFFSLIKLPVPPSRATSNTLIYITEGEAIMNVGNRKYNVCKDEMFIVPAGQVFSFNTPDINKGFLCNFDKDILVSKYSNYDLIQEFDFLKIWANPYIKLDKSISQFILNLFIRLHHEYSRFGIENIELIQSNLITLLFELKHVSTINKDLKKNSALEITKKFQELVFSHFRNKHLVSDYADILCVSPNHLNKCVKTITGKSPTKWIDESIISESKVLLYQSSLSINQIAYQVGIYDPSYFSRLFKKYEKTSPSEFRKMIEKS